MPNLFAEAPNLPPLVAPRLWTCPKTGIVIPKEPDANLKWRADLLTAAENDTDLQDDLYQASSKSQLFWINAFAFTLRVFEAGEEGKVRQASNRHLPFVTWPIQDRLLEKLEHCIEAGESLLTDKSRDTGATWCHIAALTHRLLFRPDESHLILSRKEDAVDVLDGQPRNYPFGSLADPGTLFGKIDYILCRLPEWMLPRLTRKKLHITNADTNTRIDGESSNATAGSSDRRTSIFLDEMAKMKEAESIKRSTQDVTACRLVCSTPNGAGTTFSKWRMSGTIPVFALMWWDVPGKGDGRYTDQDQLGRWRIRSPWYDQECEKRTPKEVAIELDADHVGSGDTFFESHIIDQHRKLFARLPKTRATISFKRGLPDEEIPAQIRRKNKQAITFLRNGPWQIWTNLNGDNRPDQNKTYTVGVDISKGQGASNSTINIACNETREKIAAFADANTPPHALARIAVAACLWAGGRDGLPLLIWENNGDPGFDFGNQVVQIFRYPKPYFDRATGTTREKIGKRWGWRSSPEKKAVALGLLRRAYAHGQYINPDAQALDETLTYVTYEGGGIGPAELVEESDSARKAHGDRVIADMLCNLGLRGAPRLKDAMPATPVHSIGGRFAEWKKNKRSMNEKTTFNFRAA